MTNQTDIDAEIRVNVHSGLEYLANEGITRTDLIGGIVALGRFDVSNDECCVLAACCGSYADGMQTFGLDPGLSLSLGFTGPLLYDHGIRIPDHGPAEAYWAILQATWVDALDLDTLDDLTLS